MGKDTFYYQVIAIAATFQAAYDVDQLASHGRIEESSFNHLISSLLNVNPKSIEEILDPIADFRQGLEALEFVLNGQFSESAKNWLNYSNGMLRLMRKLLVNHERQYNISKELLGINASDGALESDISRLYQQQISTMGNRIMIKGQGALLNDERIANRVRCCLLGGIRYAWLWQQLGGTRWQFMLKRRKVLEVIKSMKT